MKFDVYNLLSEKYQSDVRVSLTGKFISKLKNHILIKYGSLRNFAIQREESYQKVYSWLSTSERCKRHPTLKQITKLTKEFNITKINLFDNIVEFTCAEGSPKPIKLPRFLDLDEELVYGLFLYIGEGLNTKKDIKKSYISNRNMNILKNARKWFVNSLEINNKYIKFLPNTSERAAHHCVNNRILRLLIEELKMIAYNLVEEEADELLEMEDIEKRRKNISLTRAAFQGISDGEGYIDINGYFGITMDDKKIMTLMNKLCKLCDVETRFNKYEYYNLTVSRFNFSNLKYLGPFKFHKQRQTKFENILNSDRIIRYGDKMNYNTLLNIDSNYISFADMVDKMNCSRDTLFYRLHKLEANNLIERHKIYYSNKRLHSTDRVYAYRITADGKRFVYNVQNILNR